MDLLALDRFARTHDGLVTPDECGLDRRGWRRAVAAGKLIEIHHQVARVAGAPLTVEQRIRAAVLAGGSGTLASHRAAAHLLGLRTMADDEPVDVILGGPTRHVDLVGVVVHRPRDRRRLVPQRERGIAHTNVLRTLLDTAAVVPDAAADLVTRALGDRRADLDAIAAALEEHARPGRTGVRALRRAIADATLDRTPTDSVLEQAFGRLCERHGLPPFSFHERIAGWEVDMRFVGTPLVVECDGWTTHGLDRAQFERDRRRDDDLRAAGMVVMRLSWRMIVERPADTARRIRRQLDRCAAPSL